MKTEFEAKFLNIDIEDIRIKLKNLGAVCEIPMRLMRRAIIDYPDRRLFHEKDAYVRVRDEGNKTTLTYKEHRIQSVDGAKEIEVVVSDFTDTVAIFEEAGLKCFSLQESRRETWRLDGVEIVIDEWPWLKPYIEIEGESTKTVKEMASRLDFTWDDAIFGGTMQAYRAQYPHLKQADQLSHIERIRFDDPLPQLLELK